MSGCYWELSWNFCFDLDCDFHSFDSEIFWALILFPSVGQVLMLELNLELDWNFHCFDSNIFWVPVPCPTLELVLILEVKWVLI